MIFNLPKEFFYAASTLIGTIVGVGMFGIPYALSRAGVVPTLVYFFILTSAVILIHLFYGEIILRTKGEHRLVGYAEKYLGAWWKKIVTFSAVFGFFGALLAYLIIGGEFLNALFLPIADLPKAVLSIAVFGIIGGWLIHRDFRSIGKTEFILTAAFISAIFLIAVLAAPKFAAGNFLKVDYSEFFLPYGIIFFALTGASAIPEIRDMLGNRPDLLKKAIIIGSIVPPLIYLIFAFSVVGVSGINTSREAVAGLKSHLGGFVVYLGALVGFLTTFTSYLVLGLNLKKLFFYDLKFSGFTSWFMASFGPVLLYLSGITNFILVIGFIGAVSGGIDGTAMILTYLKAKKAGDRVPEYSLNHYGIFQKLSYVLIALFLFGAVYEIINVITNN